MLYTNKQTNNDNMTIATHQTDTVSIVTTTYSVLTYCSIDAPTTMASQYTAVYICRLHFSVCLFLRISLLESDSLFFFLILDTQKKEQPNEGSLVRCRWWWWFGSKLSTSLSAAISEWMEWRVPAVCGRSAFIRDELYLWFLTAWSLTDSPPRSQS